MASPDNVKAMIVPGGILIKRVEQICFRVCFVKWLERSGESLDHICDLLDTSLADVDRHCDEQVLKTKLS